MRSRLALALMMSALLGLVGCASAPSVPTDYRGLTAIIEDSSIRDSANRVQFFYVEIVDDRRVLNALAENRKYNLARVSA
jgi:hypothetical protein